MTDCDWAKIASGKPWIMDVRGMSPLAKNGGRAAGDECGLLIIDKELGAD